ncbi:MAG: hypothetical protein P1U68_03385 [Verrucomicrobiales bacterium]|nr:hypothetical protein [Verrucomicrobiales bacterium]
MMTNRYFSTFAFLTLLVGSVRADWVEDAVTDIRSKYNQIESATLQTQVIEFQPEDDPAYGKLTKYLENGQVVKATFIFGQGDHGGGEETYYYHNGQLFFIYIDERSWRFSGKAMANGESETIDTMTEHRLYFANGKLIRHLRKQVESTDYEAIGSLIAKVANEPYQDPAKASAAKMRGFQVPGVSSWQDIAAILGY